MRRKASDEAMLAAVERNGGNRQRAANELGLNVRNLQSHLARIREAEKTAEEKLVFTPIPDDDVPIEELVEQRKRKFAHKRDHEETSKLIPVKVKGDLPVGLLHFGDPHVDDDGTDIEALERHTGLVNATPGLFACNVGDTTNNWTGRLARLYADQTTSAAQAWRLAEWFIGRCKWLYMIGGNHDLWSGAGDPLRWIAKQQGAMYRASEARIALRFSNGAEVRVNARHDFAGSSIWNPAHGPMKAAMLGTRDHIYVAGHKHESAYSVLKDPVQGITMHTIKVASYKVYDRYARDKGFRDNALSPCAVTVINPRLAPTHPDMVKVFWEPKEGADYLTYLRQKVK